MSDNKAEHRWYNSNLVVALLTATLSLGSIYLVRCSDQKAQAQALKVAFQGEVSAIRGSLSGPIKTAYKAWQKGKVLKEYRLSYPRMIFDANAGRLGDLRDRDLVARLVRLYSLIQRTEETGRRLQVGIYDQRAFSEYLQLLNLSFYQAVALDIQLSELTKHLADENWKTKLSESDAADLNFAEDVFKKLEEQKATAAD